MDDPSLTLPVSLWMRKKTYVWSLVAVGVVQASVAVIGMSHPLVYVGGQVPLAFALNVATLGWCFVDAKERMIPISGFLRVVMLIVSLVGVPWYFLRSRGLIDAAKGWFGLGLFVLWLGSAMIALFVGLLTEALFSGGVL